MDLAFALSATALKSDDSFMKMKSVINEILNTYGSSTVRYSVIKFGRDPEVELDFGAVSDLNELKEILQRITKNDQGADLSRALRKARELFQMAAVSRPDAKRILVVAMDKMSGSDDVEVSVAARSLAHDGVRVIAVTFGKEADPQELTKATLNKDNVIETNDTASAKDIAAEVVEKANNGTNIGCYKDPYLIYFLTIQVLSRVEMLTLLHFLVFQVTIFFLQHVTPTCSCNRVILLKP